MGKVRGIKVTANIIGKCNPLYRLRRLVLELAGDILMIASGLTVAYYVRVALLFVK